MSAPPPLPPMGGPGPSLPPPAQQALLEEEEPRATAPRPASVIGSVGNIALEEDTTLPNPGQFDELTKESRQVLMTPELFDGVRLDFNKQATAALQIGHSASLSGSTEPNTYMFTSTHSDASMMMFGRLFQDFSVQGVFVANLSEKLKLQLGGVAPSNPSAPPNGNVEVDYSGKSWTSRFGWVTPGEVTVSFAKQLTQRFALGTSFMFHRTQLRAEHRAVARYVTPKWIANVSAVNAYIDGPTLALAYTHKAGDKANLSTDWTLSKDPRAAFGYRTQFSSGFQYLLTAALVKASVDSDGKIKGYLEHELSQTTRLLASAELDHWDGHHKFGFGLSMTV